MSVWDRIGAVGVVAVLVIDDVESAVPTARALVDEGVSAMELTLRTPVAVEALRRIRAEVPEMIAGIGTVLTPDQAREVAEAGAECAVAPGMNPRVVKASLDAGLPFAPGIATPSELEQAIELGCRVVKFFPAEPQGGLTYLDAMMGPYRHLGIGVIPLGGLSPSNMADYLANPHVLGIGGSWIAPRDAIVAGDWASIRERAAEASAIARGNERSVA
ncbi:MAG: bifunctional 4-hydroxy-2-oxoglutarate aldolase/2-dehydro-3-deoxy-phosphogluconate aldolase [Planctomycetota bacterium]